MDMNAATALVEMTVARRVSHPEAVIVCISATPSALDAHRLQRLLVAAGGQPAIMAATAWAVSRSVEAKVS